MIYLDKSGHYGTKLKAKISMLKKIISPFVCLKEFVLNVFHKSKKKNTFKLASRGKDKVPITILTINY